MDNQNIIDRIKSSFCNLTKFKMRQNAVEVITPFSTINNKFISVFITYSQNKIIITDNGWFDQNYYEIPSMNESKYIEKKIISSYENTYNVKSTKDQSGINYYYKTCESIEQIPNAVFDLAHFMVGVVNSFLIQHTEDREEKEINTFRNNADNFLNTYFAGYVKFRLPLGDIKGIKFNAIITKNDQLSLLTYVTGSTQQYFENELRRSIVNFEIALKSNYKDFIKNRVTIFNDQSDGYNLEKQNHLFDVLKEKTTIEPTPWSDKELLLKAV